MSITKLQCVSLSKIGKGLGGKAEFSFYDKRSAWQKSGVSQPW